MSESPTGSVCDAPIESSLHILRDCTRAREVWQRLVPPERWLGFFGEQEVSRWLDHSLRANWDVTGVNLDWKHVFKEIVNSLWFRRNKAVHGASEEIPHVSQMVQIILQRVKE